EGQRLSLRLEASDDLSRVHAGLEDLQRDAALDGARLLGHVDDTEAPFADLLEELVGADDRSRAFDGRSRIELSDQVRSRAEHEISGLVVGLEQLLDRAAQELVRTARPSDIGLALGPALDVQGRLENRSF